MAKQFFSDLPDTSTPIVANRLNGLLDGEEAMGSIVVDDVSGKNLFSFSEYENTAVGLTTIINGNNLKITGTATSTQKYITEYIKNTYGIGTYTFSITNTLSMPIILRFYDDNDTTIRSISIPKNTNSVSFTLDGTEKKYRLIFNPTNGATYNINTNLQLEKGSTATNYVEYKQPVKKTNVGVKEDTTFYANDFKCRNLFDKNSVSWYRNNSSSFSDTTNTSTTRIRTSSFAIEGGKTYTISGIPTGISLLVVSEYDTYGGTRTTYKSTTTFTLEANTKYISLIFGGSDFTDATNTLMKNANIQLEIGSQVTSYTEYKNFENEEIYSTGETVVGRWIDGKKIYRCVYRLNNYSVATGTNYYTFTPAISNFGELVKCYTTFKNQSSNHYETDSATSSLKAKAYITDTNNVKIGFVNTTGSANTFAYVNVIVEYTKTS